MGVLLRVDQIEVLYQRAIRGVQNVSLEVADRQIVALIGANGAGKSTTLRATSGFIGLDRAKVSHGTITFDGKRIDNALPHQNARRGILLVPEREKIFPNLTITENLAATVSWGQSAVDRRRQEALVYDFFPRLGELKSRQAGLVSGGERQMLAIASRLVVSPRLLLIDELSLGLAPVIVESLTSTLLEIRSRLEIAMLIVEQNATTALALADHVYLLESGSVVANASASEFRANLDVRSLYFGDQGDHGKNYRDARRLRDGAADE